MAETDKDPRANLEPGIEPVIVAGVEQPVSPFDNTDLSEPAAAGVLTTPDSPATLPENMPHLDVYKETDQGKSGYMRSKTGKIIVGTVAGMGLLAAGITIGGKGSNTEPTRIFVEVPVNPTPNIGQDTLPNTEQPKTEITNLSNPPGEINNNNLITVVRANGEKVSVNKLPAFVGETPQEIKTYAETANELLALYLSTGDANVRSEITNNQPTFNIELNDAREHVFIEPYKIYAKDPTFSNSQLIIGNDPNHPVDYHIETNSEGLREITINTGNLVRFQFSDDPKWGSTKNSSTSWDAQYWNQLRYTISTQGGKDVIVAIFWDYQK